MGKLILNTNNYSVSCAALQGGKLFIAQPTPTFSDGTGMAFTSDAKLCAIPPTALCSILSEPNEPVPCSFAVPSSAWIKGMNSGTLYNGVPLLIDGAQQNCAALKCITVRAKQTPMAEGIPVSGEVSSSNIVHNTAADMSAEDTPDFEQTGVSEDTDNATEEKREEPRDSRDIPEETKPDTENAMCFYEACGKASDCPYLKASDYIDTEGAALLLRRNSPEKERIYKAAADAAMAKNGIVWGNQAHHMISAKAIYAQKPTLVKLGNYFGYDINSKENCCFLPSRESGEGSGEQDNDSKKTTAFEVMNAAGMQWHVGQHRYTCPIDPELIKRYPRLSSIADLKCYHDAVNKRIEYILSEYEMKYFGDCPVDNPEIREWFFKSMEGFSEEIEQHLADFGKDARKSFPYYVSAQAVRYTYFIPKSDRVILLRREKDHVRAERYRFTNFIKNSEFGLDKEDELEFEIYQNFNLGISEDIFSFIMFCRNARCFISLGEDFVLPFSYGVYKKNIPESEAAHIKARFSQMLSSLSEDGSFEYVSPVEMIKKRRREVTG